jgi:tetratricopeptide (TPR) repeat protein/tRNA A-37 threonylcarbamoyl transferase component Bud32
MSDEATLGPARAPSDLALAPGDLVRHFVVIAPIGRGTGGLVVAAWDPALDRKVALKLVRATGGDPGELLGEAQALAKLAHPNVVAVYEVGTFADHVYIAMEHVAGETFDRWLAAEPRALREVVDVFAAAGAGLAAAHAAGLVHRDVKPSNLMVDAKGGVRVVDFGLARAAGGGAPAEVAGTPAYMAPEQARGDAIDARADQYAFSVAFDEAARARGRVPAWLARIVARGRAADPEARYPSMTALLAALSRGRGARRRAGLIAGFAALAVAAATQLAGRVEPPCGGGERALAGVWDADVRTAIAARFAASSHPDAAGAGERVASGLAGWSAAWSKMRVEACVATRIDRTQSEPVMDLRMRCLDRGLAALRGLTTALRRELDRDAVDGAVTAVVSLPPVAACADLEGLARTTPLPADPARRAEFLAIEREIAAIDPLTPLGSYAAAIEAGDALAARARALENPAAEGQARLAVGRAAIMAGRLQPADAALRDAIRLGARAGDDRTVALAWITRIEAATAANDFRGALAMMEAADAAVARAGDAPELAVRADLAVSDALTWVSDFDAALPRLDHALAIAERSFTAPDPSLALVLVWRGDTLGELDRADEALALVTRGLEMFRALYGGEHPRLVYPMIAYGNTLNALGRYAEAKVELERGIALGRRHGDRDPTLVDAYRHLGWVAWQTDDTAGSIAAFTRSAELAEAIGGPDDYRRSKALSGLANAQFDGGDVGAAEATWLRALESQERTLAPADPAIGWTLFFLGRAAATRGDRATAIARLEPAVKILSAAPPGEAELGLGRAQAALAMALYPARAQRARARELAAAAETTLVAAGSESSLAELRAWRAAHP